MGPQTSQLTEPVPPQVEQLIVVRILETGWSKAISPVPRQEGHRSVPLNVDTGPPDQWVGKMPSWQCWHSQETGRSRGAAQLAQASSVG